MREQFNARFEREARAISSLNHPHICTLFDVGPNYLVMELIEGETLAARLKKWTLRPKTALLYGVADCRRHWWRPRQGYRSSRSEAWQHHDRQFRVKVLDFGLARSGRMKESRPANVIGTPGLHGAGAKRRQTRRRPSDIYAFGCVLYEMMTGARVGARDLSGRGNWK